MYTHICICVCVYIYIYIYTHILFPFLKSFHYIWTYLFNSFKIMNGWRAQQCTDFLPRVLCFIKLLINGVKLWWKTAFGKNFESLWSFIYSANTEHLLFIRYIRDMVHVVEKTPCPHKAYTNTWRTQTMINESHWIMM